MKLSSAYPGHYGLVARLYDELGIGEIIDKNTSQTRTAQVTAFRGRKSDAQQCTWIQRETAVHVPCIFRES